MCCIDAKTSLFSCILPRERDAIPDIRCLQGGKRQTVFYYVDVQTQVLQRGQRRLVWVAWNNEAMFAKLLSLHSSLSLLFGFDVVVMLQRRSLRRKKLYSLRCFFSTPLHSFGSIPCSAWLAHFQLAVMLIYVLIITTETEKGD